MKQRESALDESIKSAKEKMKSGDNAGAIAYAGGDYQDAAIAMQQALALQSQYANAMYVLGLSLPAYPSIPADLLVWGWRRRSSRRSISSVCGFSARRAEKPHTKRCQVPGCRR